jgi:hypothetical protein
LFNFGNTWTTATPPAISSPSQGEGPQKSEVFDDIIDRETDVARIAAIVASDFRFAYFGTAAFAVRLLRLDQKLMDGIPMNPRRMANLLNVTPELLRSANA